MTTMTVSLCDFNYTPRKTERLIVSMMTVPGREREIILIDMYGQKHTFYVDGSAHRFLKIDWEEGKA